MGLWKCGTIAQHSLGNSAQSWVLSGEETINMEVGDSNMSEASKAIYAKRLALIENAPQSDMGIDFSLPIMKKCFRKFLNELKSLFVFSVGFIGV